jgi:hypothetical protein
MKYNHIGIPTKTPRPAEQYLPEHKLYISGGSQTPYGIEWLRFEHDSPFPELIQQVAHVGFEVDDINQAVAGKDILIPPTKIAEGLTIAFIAQDGAPVELLQIDS